MAWLAAGLVALSCALAVAGATGSMPEFRRIRVGARRSSARRVWLAQAGVGVTPVQFWVGSAALGVVTLVAVTAFTGAPLVAFVPAMGVATLPYSYLGRRRTQRLRRVQDVWPDGLRDLRASIAAGRSMAHSLQALATTGPEPLRDAFASFPALARTLGTTTALGIIEDQLADPTSDRVLEVLTLAQERGGSTVVDVLDDLIAATTKDLKVLDEIETDGLEQRINARAVLVLPWFVLVALCLRDGPFRDFYRSGSGVLIVLAGGLMSSAGYLIVSRLARTQGEPRVFGLAPDGAS